MKAHQLAQLLLSGKDLPVVIHGYGSEESEVFEVTGVGEPEVFSFCIREETESDKIWERWKNTPQPAQPVINLIP